MAISKNKIISSLSALSALAALAPITGNNHWLTFLSFLSFFSFSKVNMDERMKTNLDRAARNGFIVSVICLIALMLYVLSAAGQANVIMAIELSLVAITVVFSGSFTAYDKFGK
jgi:hypothetical protein